MYWLVWIIKEKQSILVMKHGINRVESYVMDQPLTERLTQESIVSYDLYFVTCQVY